MAASFEVKGLRELGLKLRELGDKVERQIADAALRQAANVIRDDARQKAPVLAIPTKYRKPGVVKRAIVSKKGRAPKGQRKMVVGVRGLTGAAIRKFKASGGAAAQNPNDPFYWYFLERGTSKMAAKPFLRPAFDATNADAVTKFTEVATARIESEWKK